MTAHCLHLALAAIAIGPTTDNRYLELWISIIC
jgi:hypothetical protein